MKTCACNTDFEKKGKKVQWAVIPQLFSIKKI